MKVTIATMINTNHHLMQLANSPLPAKARYWVGRIAITVGSALQGYEQQRVAKVKELGEPVKYEQVPPIVEDGKEVPQPPKRIILTGADEAKTANQWEVTAENIPQFNEWIATAQAEIVELTFDGRPYNKVPLSLFGDTQIAANIAVLDWMIDDEGLVA